MTLIGRGRRNRMTPENRGLPRKMAVRTTWAAATHPRPVRPSSPKRRHRTELSQFLEGPILTMSLTPLEATRNEAAPVVQLDTR